MKIASALLYYLFMLPLSLLPFGVLHAISSFLFFVLYYIVGYRKEVVRENIRRSFPEKSEEERNVIAKKFYRHLCDVFLESQKMFTITKSNLAKHITCANPEIINRYYEQGKNVIIAVGHYNSWELMLTGFNTFIRHKAVVIYQPLRNTFFDKKLRDARSERGTLMIPAQTVKSFFSTPSNELYATVFAIDQSPPNPEKSYWMNFLHQDTPVLFGTEKYAKDFNLPVVYARLNKIKRGYYQLEFVNVVADPAATAYGEITEKVTKLLENDIISKPEFWLWSHKRWKHKRK
ncbi:MAG: lysophospholipid acyltransferase family protein [Bacteroidota bacterium]|nr:lysophospholipid acyltransferase family protein [Bacteroidota bacterium]